jgi:thiol-disulfide isomerase/thioredoxin
MKGVPIVSRSPLAALLLGLTLLAGCEGPKAMPVAPVSPAPIPDARKLNLAFKTSPRTDERATSAQPEAGLAKTAGEVKDDDLFGEEEKEPALTDKPVGKPLAERIREANGEEFLELHGPTYGGETFNWASYRGQAVMVVFWASWCPHSKELLSKLENLRRVAHSYKVDVVGVNVDRTPERANSYLEVAEFPFENIIDSKQKMELDREYPTTALPTVVMVNKAGKIVPFDVAETGVESKLIELCQEPYTGPLTPKSHNVDKKETSKASSTQSSKAVAQPSPAVANGKAGEGNEDTGNAVDSTADDDPLFEAKAGVGKKGRGYGGGIYTEPLKARWTIEQKLVFDVKIPKALSLFQATNERYPNSHKEFMKEIIEASSIELPELPAGQEYVYVPEKGKLMVRKAKE